MRKKKKGVSQTDLQMVEMIRVVNWLKTKVTKRDNKKIRYKIIKDEIRSKKQNKNEDERNWNQEKKK